MTILHRVPGYIKALIGVAGTLAGLYFGYTAFVSSQPDIDFRLADAKTTVTYAGLRFSLDVDILNRSSRDTLIIYARVENQFRYKDEVYVRDFVDNETLTKRQSLKIPARGALRLSFDLTADAYTGALWTQAILATANAKTLPPAPRESTFGGLFAATDTPVPFRIEGGDLFTVVNEFLGRGGRFYFILNESMPRGGDEVNTMGQPEACNEETFRHPVVCPVLTVKTIDGEIYESEPMPYGFFASSVGG